MKRITLTLNGKAIDREVQDSRLLVEFLREDLKLTGTKESCGVGVCGACTVLLDGSPIALASRSRFRLMGARSRPSKVLQRMTGYIRFRRRFSRTADCNVASARLGRSLRPKRYSTPIHAPRGWRSSIG
jgi:ferredoxin